jgi:hypothetical protein
MFKTLAVIFFSQLLALVITASASLALLPKGSNQFECELELAEILLQPSCGNALDEQVALICKNLTKDTSLTGVYVDNDLTKNLLDQVSKVGQQYKMKIFNLISGDGWHSLSFKFLNAAKESTTEFRIAIDSTGPMAALGRAGALQSITVTDAYSQIERIRIWRPSGEEAIVYERDVGVTKIAEQLVLNPRHIKLVLKENLSDGSVVILEDTLGNQNYFNFTSGILKYLSEIPDLTPPSAIGLKTGESGESLEQSRLNMENGIGLVVVINSYNWEDTGPAEDREPMALIIREIRDQVRWGITSLGHELRSHGLAVDGFVPATLFSIKYILRDVVSQKGKEVIFDGNGVPIISNKLIDLPFNARGHAGEFFRSLTVKLGDTDTSIPFADLVLDHFYQSGEFISWPRERNRVVSFFDDILSGGHAVGGTAPNSKIVFMANKYYWESESSKEVADAVAHELLHSFGFTHVGWARGLYQGPGYTPAFPYSNFMDYRAHGAALRTLTRSQAINFRARLFSNPPGQFVEPWPGASTTIRGISSGSEHFYETDIFGSGQRAPILVNKPFNRDIFPTDIGGDSGVFASFPFYQNTSYQRFCAQNYSPTLRACEDSGFGDHNYNFAGEGQWQFLLPGDVDALSGEPLVWQKSFSSFGFYSTNGQMKVDLVTTPIDKGIFDAWSFTEEPPSSTEEWIDATMRGTAVVELTLMYGSGEMPGYSLYSEAGHFRAMISSVDYQRSYTQPWPASEPELLAEGTPHLFAVGLKRDLVTFQEYGYDTWNTESPRPPPAVEVGP